MLHRLVCRKHVNPQGSAVSIAFDDNKQNQYDYAFPLLKSRGMVGTFYVTTDYLRDYSLDRAYMDITELHDLQNSGCEIASHSQTHPHFTCISDDQIRSECSVSKHVLQSYGFKVNNFAYPYGETNDHVDSIVRSYYRSGRTGFVPPYIMHSPTSKFRLSGAAGEPGDNAYARLMRYKRFRLVDQVYDAEGWMIMFFHNVVPDIDRARRRHFDICTRDFADLLDYLKLKHVKTLTVDQALDDLGG